MQNLLENVAIEYENDAIDRVIGALEAADYVITAREPPKPLVATS